MKERIEKFYQLLYGAMETSFGIRMENVTETIEMKTVKLCRLLYGAMELSNGSETDNVIEMI